MAFKGQGQGSVYWILNALADISLYKKAGRAVKRS